MLRFSAMALACACVFSSTTAMAASEASARLDGLTFTLIDLNPFDGVAPTVSFLTTSGTTAISVSASDNFVGESESASRTRAGTFSFSKDYLVELTNAGASASIGSQALSAVGHANGPSTSFGASASTGNANSYYSNLTISLSANAALLINANVHLSAEASNGSCTSYYYYCGYYSNADSATATAGMSLSYSYYGNGVSVNYNQSDSRSLTATSTGTWNDYTYVYNPLTGWYNYVQIVHQGQDESKSLSEVLSATFTNMTGMSQSAALSLSVSVSGQASTAALVAPMAPVPEADALFMGLAGLGVVAAMSRRRRSA